MTTVIASTIQVSATVKQWHQRIATLKVIETCAVNDAEMSLGEFQVHEH